MHTKYKKIKDVLQAKIKNDIRDFTQDEVKQKINFCNQEEYQTMVDKKLINHLEREIEFLKLEISTKNEIIRKLLNNGIRQNKTCSMVGETWDFDVTHETSDSESTCSTSNSEHSIVESRDVITVNTEISNMNIDDQLKMIREKKHQEHLLNTGCKSLSLENTKITKTRNSSAIYKPEKKRQTKQQKPTKNSIDRWVLVQ